jgi:Tfp pilus assembly protein PilF
MVEDKATLVEEALDLAKGLRQKGRYDEASQLLLGVLGHGVQADKVLFQLGNVFFDAGDLSRAEYSYRRATQVNPNFASAHNNLSVVLKRQKKIAEALKAQRKAMMLDLRSGGSDRRPLSPEASRWARGISYHGMLAVVLAVTLFILIIYSL